MRLFIAVTENIQPSKLEYSLREGTKNVVITTISQTYFSEKNNLAFFAFPCPNPLLFKCFEL